MHHIPVIRLQKNKISTILKVTVLVLQTIKILNGLCEITANIGDDVKTVDGNFEIGSQYHYTMETQSTICVPTEDGGIDVHCSTQWADLTQVAVAQMLNISQNQVNLTIKRLGGAYGAKFSRATQIACACALACHLINRPVRFVMTIEANMATIGKRTACINEYSVIEEKHTGKITALTNTFLEDSGCSINEIVVPLTAHAFHNSYGPNPEWIVKPGVARTSLPSNTWCRVPMHTEGISMIENIMEHIGHEVKKDVSEVRLANIQDNDPMKPIYIQFLKDTGK